MTHEEKIAFIKEHGHRYDFPSGGYSEPEYDGHGWTPGEFCAIYGARWDSEIVVNAEPKEIEEFLDDFFKCDTFFGFGEMFNEEAAQKIVNSGRYIGLEMLPPDCRDSRFAIVLIEPQKRLLRLRGGFLK